MGDELEQPGITQDSASENAGSENQNETGDDLLNQDQSDESDSQEQTDEEEEELEVAGKRIALPKSVAETLKAERLMQADYTRKTQEVAATRQQVEAEKQQFQQQQQMHQAHIQDIAELARVDKQLAELAKLGDLSQYTDSDPLGVQRVLVQRQALIDERNSITNNLAQKQQQFALNQQQEIAKQLQDAEAYVQREIPGWSDQRFNDLKGYLAKQGANIDQNTQLLRAIVQNPVLLKLIDGAEKFSRLAQQQKPTKTPTPPPEPVTRVSTGKQAARKDPEKMSTDEWMAHRNAQLKKR